MWDCELTIVFATVCCLLHSLQLLWKMEEENIVGLPLYFSLYAAAAAKLLQSCPTLCDPTDSNPPGSPVPGILQARTLEWVAISFPNAWKWKVKGKSLSRVRLFATLWTAAYQAPPSMGFSRQEYWSGVPLPSLILYMRKVKFAEIKPSIMSTKAGGPKRALETYSFCWPSSSFLP